MRICEWMHYGRRVLRHPPLNPRRPVAGKSLKGRTLSNDEAVIEAEIQAKGLNAPRLMPAQIDAQIDAQIVAEQFIAC
jgi:hypothetical protein